MAAIEAKTVILSVYPGVIADEKDGVSVGRVLLPEQNMGSWTPDDKFLRFYNALNGKNESATSLRRGIVYTLNNNSPNTNVVTAHERALSAYFTYSPQDEILIVEWGMINAKGFAKLHTYLNKVIDYQVRAMQGMQLSSGHLARVTGTETYLAFLDRLSTRNEYVQNQPMARMINTLHIHGFIPLTCEGFVQVPFF